MDCDVCNDSGVYWNGLLQEMRPCPNECAIPPGTWHCPTCRYQLEKCNLDPSTLAVTPNDDPAGDCPNCKTRLLRQPVK